MSGLVLTWRCGDNGRGDPGRGDAGYKTGSQFVGAHVIHLWDPASTVLLWLQSRDRP